MDTDATCLSIKHLRTWSIPFVPALDSSDPDVDPGEFAYLGDDVEIVINIDSISTMNSTKYNSSDVPSSIYMDSACISTDENHVGVGCVQ
jgi:hypothetical protein